MTLRSGVADYVIFLTTFFDIIHLLLNDDDDDTLVILVTIKMCPLLNMKFSCQIGESATRDPLNIREMASPMSHIIMLGCVITIAHH
jgi:hypothetical protein